MWEIEFIEPLHDLVDPNGDGSTYNIRFHNKTFNGPFEALDYLTLYQDELNYHILVRRPLIKKLEE